MCVEHASHTLTNIHSRYGDHGLRSRSLTHVAVVVVVVEKSKRKIILCEMNAKDAQKLLTCVFVATGCFLLLLFLYIFLISYSYFAHGFRFLCFSFLPVF